MIEMHQITLTEYADIKQKIRNNHVDIAEKFIEIGYYLKVVRDNKMYMEDGYKDVYEFAKKEYGYSYTVAFKTMQVNDEFSIGGDSPCLQPQYKNYSKSLLIEMVAFPEEDRELITADTSVKDIQKIKKAEKQQKEKEKKEKEQVQGQESIMSLMPNVVPEAEKPKKQEKTISDVLRELFKPREMKEYLDSLVNMDPDSQAMEWWVDGFYQTNNKVYSKFMFLICFYPLSEGVKVKNIQRKTIDTYTYKDFYFLVRAAFGQETVRGTDVWNQAFGEEYEEELHRQKEEEQRKKEAEERKKELQKQREVKENQQKPVKSEEKKPQKVIMEPPAEEKAVTFNKINENSDSDNEKEVVDNNLNCSDCEYYYKEEDGGVVDCHYKPCEDNEWNDIPPCERKEKAEIVTGEVEENPEVTSEKEEKPLCDIAQASEGFVITLPAAIGQRLYCVHEPQEDRKAYTAFIYPYMYEIRSEKNIKMYYWDEMDRSHEISVRQMESSKIYTNMEEAKKEEARLNGEEK